MSQEEIESRILSLTTRTEQLETDLQLILRLTQACPAVTVNRRGVTYTYEQHSMLDIARDLDQKGVL